MSIDKAIWEAVPVVTSPALAAMHKVIFAQAALKKVRSPRWTFELADDLAVQMQARMNGPVPWYEGRLLTAPGASRQMLLAAHQPRGVWLVFFRISAGQDPWLLKCTGVRWPSGESVPEAEFFQLRSRLVAAFAGRAFEDLGNYGLAGHCICCGKQMSDPVSMARHVGPECWGTASVTLPFFLQAQTAKTEEA